MTGFDFHPEALTDLDEIWDFIAVEYSPLAILPQHWPSA